MTSEPSKETKNPLKIKLPNDFLTNQKKVRELTPEEKAWAESIDYATSDTLPNLNSEKK